MACGYNGNASVELLHDAGREMEACVPFAALTYVGESVQAPARYYLNNVGQSIALFEGPVEQVCASSGQSG